MQPRAGNRSTTRSSWSSGAGDPGEGRGGRPRPFSGTRAQSLPSARASSPCVDGGPPGPRWKEVRWWRPAGPGWGSSWGSSWTTPRSRATALADARRKIEEHPRFLPVVAPVFSVVASAQLTVITSESRRSRRRPSRIARTMANSPRGTRRCSRGAGSVRDFTALGDSCAPSGSRRIWGSIESNTSS